MALNRFECKNLMKGQLQNIVHSSLEIDKFANALLTLGLEHSCDKLRVIARIIRDNTTSLKDSLDKM